MSAAATEGETPILTERMIGEYLEETTHRGVVLVDGLGRIRVINERVYELLEIPAGNFGPDSSFTAFLSYIVAHSPCATASGEEYRQSLHPFSKQQACYLERWLDTGKRGPDQQLDGKWLALTGRVMSSGGYAFTVTDISQKKSVIDVMKRTNRAAIMALADLAENRDHDTGEHVLKVARMTHEISRNLQPQGHPWIDLAFMEYVGLASVLHDVGKVTIPDHILLKPGKLTPDELVIMRQHVVNGKRILTKILDTMEDNVYMDMALQMAMTHHEHFDGNGYPHGIVGEKIPLSGRIVAVADVFDALISWRPYKQPWPLERAMAFIQEQSGRMFDPNVVQAFEQVMAKRAQALRVVWTTDMSVGVQFLDQDHKLLIDLINQMERCRSENDLVAVEFVVDELYNYTIRHFQREEVFMESGSFPDLMVHKRSHAAMTSKVHDLRQRFLRSYSQNVASELFQLIGTWLKQHILVEDKRYQSFFQQQGSLPCHEIGISH